MTTDETKQADGTNNSNRNETRKERIESIENRTPTVLGLTTGVPVVFVSGRLIGFVAIHLPAQVEPTAVAVAHPFERVGLRHEHHDREPAPPYSRSTTPRPTGARAPLPARFSPLRRDQTRAGGKSEPHPTQTAAEAPADGLSGRSGSAPTRSLVGAKGRKVGLQCDSLSYMCGPEDDDGDAHARARARPHCPIVACLVREADVPPQSCSQPRATAHAGRGRARADAFHIECLIPYLQRAELCARALGARGAGWRRARVSSRVMRTAPRSRLRASSATCAACSPPPSGRGVSGSQTGPH